jgi:hypothetical protein
MALFDLEQRGSKRRGQPSLRIGLVHCREA